MDEIWKDIEGYEGRYQISNTGRIKSLSREVRPQRNPYIVKERVLSPWLNENGYSCIALCDGKGNKKRDKIHRLVAKHFLGKPKLKSLIEVNHIDENKTNNRVDNLEWCTSQYNCDYSLARDYIFKSPDGNRVEIRNLRQFCIKRGLTDSGMRHVYNGREKSYRGWTRWTDD